MSQASITTASLANRRRTRRCQANGQTRTECRKGTFGFGRNVAVNVLDLSETGARLVVRTPLDRGDEVELLLAGHGLTKPLRQLGKVVWSLPLPDDCHAIGVAFDKPLPYVTLQRLTRS
jgi:hypothetical protein